MDRDDSPINREAIISNLQRQTSFHREYLSEIVRRTSPAFLKALDSMDEDAWGAVHQALQQDANKSAALYNLFTFLKYTPGMNAQEILAVARSGVENQLQEVFKHCQKESTLMEKGIDYRSRAQAKRMLKKL